MLSIVKDAQRAGFTYREGESSEETFVSVTTSEKMEESKWRLVVGSPVVLHCMCAMVKRMLTVNQIHIFAVAYKDCEENVVESVHCKLSVTDCDGKKSDRMMVMKGHKSGVLIVFRVSGESTRTREYVLTVNNNEIVVGDLVDNRLVSSVATMAQTGGNILLHMRNFHRLFSQKNSYGPVVVDSDSTDETLDLYLYRKNITTEEFKRIQETEFCQNKKMQLHPLGDAWRTVKDAKTISALFLFHELRYHNIMPLYRSPIADETATQELKKPVYTKLEKLIPRRHFNFAVKIHCPAELVTEYQAPDGKGRKVYDVIVGDETGTIKLNLTGDDSIEKDYGCVGTSLVLRNCAVEMSAGVMRLKIGQWSKVEKDDLPSDVSFDFEVKEDCDLSIRKPSPTNSPARNMNSSNNSNPVRNRNGPVKAGNNNNNRNKRRSPGRNAVKA